MAKETKAKKGKYEYYRTKVRHPVTGEYRDVYGRSKAERDEKAEALEDAWAKEIVDAESPYVYQYAADWYAAASAHMSDARSKEVRRQINDVICPLIGDLRLREVTSDDLRRVMASRGSLSAAAQEKTRQVLRRLFRDAEEAGKCPRDPSRNLKVSGAGTKQKDALTPQQQETLLAAVKGLPAELFCVLGLYAGLRREEICALQWDCVDLSDKAPQERRSVAHGADPHAPGLHTPGRADAPQSRPDAPGGPLRRLQGRWRPLDVSDAQSRLEQRQGPQHGLRP